MGSYQSQFLNESTTVTNNVFQAANSNCTFDCTQSISGNVIIVTGGTGDLTIENSCKITKPTCTLTTVLGSAVTNTISQTAKQTAAAAGGLSFTFNAQNQNINLNAVVQTNVTQVATSNCTISADQDITDNLLILTNHSGNILLSNTADIDRGTCTLSTTATSAITNTVTQDAKQDATVTNCLESIAGIIIVLIICFTAVIMTFIIVGGKIVTSPTQLFKGGNKTTTINQKSS